ncbi:hypothetical protein THRCLA_10534 [Thraustotheca clavata]|uniref:Mediator of RNA polymerase II transcription subunit 22 n=1 Tax=Thraustotheca clavata TaxID=74557 RepID=A0A1V9YLE5_9STRA|nr:hypothetical protein THRCLA_10534 [Thraustotheca clavata]
MAEEYRQRLDNNVEKLIENYKGLITSSKVKERTQTSRQALQSAVYATSMVQASEALLKLVAELKLSLTLNDFEGINQKVNGTCEGLKEKCDDVDISLGHLATDIASALFELEGHYYQSRWRSADMLPLTLEDDDMKDII